MMSSAETLNFGPQWLRDLSEGSGTSSNSATTSQIAAASKFKLAENRYGREEMLALFVEDSEIPEELNRAPSLVTEVVQVPLALRPSSEHPQTQLSTPFRGRGAPSSGLRGRSTSGRGRGRGRGTPWADHDDGPIRRPPLLRRAESEDWRSDSFRGKGDGAEDIMGGLKEWRVSGQRNDFWKDAWRDRPGDVGELRGPRGRSMSSKDAEDSDRRWRDDEMNNVSVKSKPSESSREAPDAIKELTDEDGTPEKKKQPLKNPAPNKNQNGDVRNDKPNSPASELGFQKSTKEPKPFSEGSKTPNGGQGEGHQDQSPPPERNSLQQNPDNLSEDVFRKFPASDSGGGEVKIPLSQLFQDMTIPNSEPVSTSLDGTASQNLLFFANSPVGDIAATSTSPIAQLQALATTWYYKDPQGDEQGPFSSNQMMEWYRAGYFTMVLLVKRACDKEFAPLGELIKRWGQVPFAPTPKSVAPQAAQPDGNLGTLMQQKFAEQQKVQHLRQQQQASMGRPFQPQPGVNEILAQLVKNPEFLKLSQEQQQLFFFQYASELKRQSETTHTPFQSAVTSESIDILGNHPNEAIVRQPDLTYHQKMMEEARKKEEEEIRRIQKQQEEQKEFLRKQEEEFRRKKELLMREEERIKQLELEAQRKKEELQRKIEEDEKLKKIQEMQDRERRRKMEEEEKRKRELEMREAEERRLREEEERRRQEEERKRIEEEKALRLEEQRQQELRRLEIEREEQRMREEKRKQEERDKQAAKEAEIQRKADAAKIRREKETEAKVLAKKQQQKRNQPLQVELPRSAKWGDGQQTTQSRNDSLSLVEILKLEKQQEQIRQQEEQAKMARETRNQQPKPKTGWGTSNQETSGVSLLDIQREEAKHMSTTKQAPKPEKIPNLGMNTSWNKPPKIQPDPPKRSQTVFWDQVVEETPPKPNPVRQSQARPQQAQKQTKQQKATKKTKSDEGQQIKALFQQQITKDGFTDWCETYLRKMNAGSIDIPTFVNFLRDVESPFEVEEYVQSYLGETKEAKDFASLFLEQRSKIGRSQYDNPQHKGPDKARSATARDTDGFEVVTANTKRGKKKLRKLQKVDPSILGFSVNASSDRVNMGEIQTADD